jgi:hypothetical protein
VNCEKRNRPKKRNKPETFREQFLSKKSVEGNFPSAMLTWSDPNAPFRDAMVKTQPLFAAGSASPDGAFSRICNAPF